MMNLSKYIRFIYIRWARDVFPGTVAIQKRIAPDENSSRKENQVCNTRNDRESQTMSTRDIQYHADSAKTLTIREEHDFVTEFMYALSELLGGLPEDFPPLHDYIEPEVLESLFGPAKPPNGRFEGTLTFRMGMHMIHLETYPGTGTNGEDGKVLLAVTSY